MKKKKRNAETVLVRKQHGNRPLRKLICGWENNIKMDLKEIRYGDVNWFRIESNAELL
jgi:hypothetical protein